MNELTNFQKKCEEKLSEALLSYDRGIEGRELGGTDEVYIHGYISNSDIEIWIYDDEAMIGGHNIDFRFEKPDFDSSNELMEAFVRKAISICKADGK